jgi:glucose/arabinose dehydrogenase
MRRYLTALTATALALAGLTAPARAATPDPRTVRAGWTRVAGGLDQPLALSHPDGDARLFVAERTGRIRVIKGGRLLARPFLDVRSRLGTSGEGGLLSVAFRPDYRSSGLFYVAWTDPSFTLHVTRYHATPSADVAQTAGVDVLTVPHPGESNHNGGQLAFGPAGFLFIGTGDGGGAGDANGNAQNLGSLLGKILRIDVNHTSPGKQYAVPSNNPFRTRAGAKPEIWLYGLRNPWRFSFDRGHPDLYIGDVGQNDREEIDKVSTGGLNLGWDCREGGLDTSPGHSPAYGGSYCTGSGYTAPYHEYTHSSGCAIIGGYTYRGSRYASLAAGNYLYGDYCSGRLWLLGRDANGRLVGGGVNVFPHGIFAFGRDNAGELYLLSDDGGVYRIAFAKR